MWSTHDRLRIGRGTSSFARPMAAPKDFQGLLLALQSYWAERGCALMQGYDLEVGAGTMNPATFLRVLGPEPWNVAYVEPSRRPADGRFGENPNRLHQHHQYQVILKPSPKDVQEQYLGSLRAIGITSDDHDLRFVDEYESECRRLVEKKLPLPAYDYCLKCSHTFNLLDARGAISVTERQGYILRVRKLAHDCAKLYLATRARMKFPSLADRALAEKELARHAELLADQPVRSAAEPRRAERR